MSGRTHLIGIGGIGMSALAKLLLARREAVSGSDVAASSLTEELRRLGAQVTIGHRAELVEGAARAVYSDAVHDDNPELRRARQIGLPTLRRSQLLAELMEGRRGIAISGTHGKTTVAAMVGLILTEAGMDPTVVLGGEYAPLGGNARVGSGAWMVVEACEAYESYLDLSPEVAVITNIDPDHLDHHGTEARLRASFSRFLDRIVPGGRAVLCADRPELHELAARVDREVITYGLTVAAQIRGIEPCLDGLGGGCRVSADDRDQGELRLAVPGRHNLVNALGAVAAARLAGVPIPAALAALASFRGVGRRFEVLGEANGIAVVDDYAHHPAELAATLEAARAAFPGRRLVAVFQPHLYSRTRDFAEEFAGALAAADAVVLTEIYPAREAPLPGVTTRLILRALRQGRGEDGAREVAKRKLVAALSQLTRAGDVVLMMGAGDIGQVAREFASSLGITPGEERAAPAKP